MSRNTLVVAALGLALLGQGCVKRIPLPYEKVERGSRVWVKTVEQRELAGDVVDKKPDRFVLRTFKGDVDTLLIADVVEITARPQEYDEAGRLITEREIDSVKTHRNLVLYSIGGTALSFGASFYLGSFVRRHVNTGEDVALWGITGLGTAAGLATFSRAGANRDRLMALEKIKDYRKEQAAKELQRQKSKREQLEEELRRLKEEQRKKQEELERLKKLLEKKKSQLNAP